MTMKRIYPVLVLFFLIGCASSAERQKRITGMAVSPLAGTVFSDPTPLTDALSIGEINCQIGRLVCLTWKMHMKAALTESFSITRILAEGEGGRYELRTDIKSHTLSSEMFSPVMTATFTVHYTLVDSRSGQTLFDETITTTDRTTRGSSTAVRKNLSELVERLHAVTKGGE